MYGYILNTSERLWYSTSEVRKFLPLCTVEFCWVAQDYRRECSQLIS
jgi:hypothetical protein